MNKKYTFLSFCICLLFSLQISAQTDFTRVPPISEYFFNQLIYNPAFAGEDDQATIGLAMRRSDGTAFSNFNLSGVNPSSIYGFIHGNLLEQIGLGLTVQYENFNDTTLCFQVGGVITNPISYCQGNRRSLQLGLVQNYKFAVSEGVTVVAGMNVGLMHYRSDNVRQGANTTSLQTNERFFKLNVDFGFLLKARALRLGLSMNHVNEPTFQFFANNRPENFRRETHLTGNYTFASYDSTFQVQPTFMLNTIIGNNGFFNNNTTWVDLGILARYKSLFAGFHYKINHEPYRMSLTVGSRVIDALQLSATVNFKKSSTSSRYNNYSRIEATLGFYLKDFNNFDYEGDDIDF